MRSYLLNILQNAGKTWIVLTAEILLTSFLYAILRTNGLPNQTSIILTCIGGGILISIDMLITHKFIGPFITTNLNPKKHKLTKEVHVSSIAAPTKETKEGVKNYAALIVEVIMSLFGLFGVGWLMAGKTKTGHILFTSSILFYWPIIIIGTIFTEGFDLIILVPIMITAIITNAILLSKNLPYKPQSFVGDIKRTLHNPVLVPLNHAAETIKKLPPPSKK